MKYHRFVLSAFLTLLFTNSFAQNSNGDFKTPFTKYTVSTTACTKITHFTGSLIFIPQNAFALDPAKGLDSVDIYFREMHTPLDMIVHDIPMVTRLMGRPFFLESNGMFEIWSKAGNDTINVHEDKSIEVRLAMQPGKIDIMMEGFRFDVSDNVWESYNRLNNVQVNDNDEDLWGSSSVQDVFAETRVESFDGEEEWVEMQRADSIRKVAFQAMEIYDFGLYNYDKIIEGETFVPVKANFVVDSKPITYKIYVVYDNLNSVFYYYPDQWETDFALIKDRSYKLFAISDQGKIASLNDFPVLEEIKGQEYVFSLEMESKVPESREELSSLTGVR